MPTPRQQIAAIDKLIDANRAAMIRCAAFNPRTAQEWQALWDRFPTYHARERGLFHQRGIAQFERDQADLAEHRQQQRVERAKNRTKYRALKQCQHCGSYTRAA